MPIDEDPASGLRQNVRHSNRWQRPPRTPSRQIISRWPDEEMFAGPMHDPGQGA